MNKLNIPQWGKFDLSSDFDLSRFYDRVDSASRATMSSVAKQLAAHISRNHKNHEKVRESLCDSCERVNCGDRVVTGYAPKSSYIAICDMLQPETGRTERYE